MGVRNQTFEDVYEQRFLGRGENPGAKSRFDMDAFDGNIGKLAGEASGGGAGAQIHSHALHGEQSMHAAEASWPNITPRSRTGEAGGVTTWMDTAMAQSQKNTMVGKVLQSCLKFCGVLDRNGAVTAESYRSQFSHNKRKARTHLDRKNWIERPEVHTQYASGKVMFRSEVSRLMATVFYTPGLMELVDSLTRDAGANEDIGHHVRIWSVPLPEALHGKTMGDAFEQYAAGEALVIGVYRNASRAAKAISRRKHRASEHHGRSKDSALGEQVHQRQRQFHDPLNGGGSRPHLSDSESSGSEHSDGDNDAEKLVGDADQDNGLGHHYVLTAPPASVRLNPLDKLYIIATTDWAWVNVPELIELRKVSAVICLQRRFRTRRDLQKQKQRSLRLRASGVRAVTSWRDETI
jgi:hypothetical protein